VCVTATRPSGAQLRQLAAGCWLSSDGERAAPVSRGDGPDGPGDGSGGPWSRAAPVAVGPADPGGYPSERGPYRSRVVLAEGKNREVRRLFASAGLDVTALKRTRVGGYRLPRDLAPGKARRLRPHEVRRVTNLGEQTRLQRALGVED